MQKRHKARYIRCICTGVNSLRQRQKGHHFADIFKSVFLNENVWISLEISLKFVLQAWINNIPALVGIMAWHWPGLKHYLNQCWLVYRCIYVSLGLNELTHWPQRDATVIWNLQFQTPIKDRYLEHFLWYCPQVNATRPHWWVVNTGSGMPPGNRPLL